MANYRVPNGAIVSIESATGAVKNMTAVSNATEAVATLEASHGVGVGDIIRVVTSGWTRLSGRVLRAKTVATNDVTLEGFNTTDTTIFPAAGGAGTVKEATAFTQIVGILGVNTSGGDQQFATFSPLEEFDERQVPTVRSPISLSLSISDDVSAAHYSVLDVADSDRQPRVIKIVVPGGSPIYYNGIITMNKTPTMTSGQVMALAVTISLQAAVTRYAS